MFSIRAGDYVLDVLPMTSNRLPPRDRPIPTPEMIDAGEAVYVELAGEFPPDYVVSEVFLAMQRASGARNGEKRQHSHPRTEGASKG